MLEGIDRILQQPTAVAWLLLLIAVGSALTAVCSALALTLLRAIGTQLVQQRSFSDHAQTLLDRGSLDELVAECRNRLQTFADDVAAHYFMGMALQRMGDLRQALRHFKRVPELHAGWDVSPLIQALEQRLTAISEPPDLKVVPGATRDDKTNPTE
jgi:tetratricopeptide (TPR) repeat protein